MRATSAKKLKISKPYFQISVNFENPQNPSCMIWKSILKNLKNLNLEVAGGDLKGGGFRFNRVVASFCMVEKAFFFVHLRDDKKETLPFSAGLSL